MRIILLTPGTGSFYCGSCMRDNTLAAALHRKGHEALVVPMYLPLMLDEEQATDNTPLFYGGINVYLQQVAPLFRHTPRWLDRFLDSPGMLKAAGRRAGMTSASQLGDLTLSMLRGEEGNQAKELDRLVSWLSSDGMPDVVCLSNALLLGLAHRIKERTGVPVVCTLQGEDGFLDSLPEPARREAWQTLSDRAAWVDAFIAVSRYYGNVMGERVSLPRDRVHVVYNGILLDGYPPDPRPEPPSPPVLGYLARMCPEKGLETLIEAYILLSSGGRVRDIKLKAAGAMTAKDEPFVARMRRRLAAEGLESETVFFPNIDRSEKIAFLQTLSVFSAPATYGESFGLYLIEAMAAGVPVVQPRHAAFPELLEATGGGLLCDPDDPRSLASAIEDLFSDPEKARSIGEKGRQAVRGQFTADRMAGGVLGVFEKVASQVGDRADRKSIHI